MQNFSTVDESLSGYYNIGAGQPRTIRGIAETLISLYGKDISPEITYKFRKGDIRHGVADISKAKATFGYTPQVSFEDGMRELIQWSETVESVDKFEEVRQELQKRGLV